MGELVAAICERSSAEEALLGAYEAHVELLSQERAEPARTLERALARLAPALYDRQLGDQLLRTPGGRVLKVPVATSMIAEVVMARVDDRPYRFLKAEARGRFPEPFASVAMLPTERIDPTKTGAFREFVDHLARVFVDESDRSPLQRPESPRPESERYAELATLVNDELEWRARPAVEGLRRYVLFDRDFARRQEAFLARVRKCLPALRLLALTGGDLVGERRLRRPLREVLYRSQRRTDRA